MLRFEQLSEQEKDFKVDNERFRSIPSVEKIQETITSLESKNHTVTFVKTKEEALELIKNLIPENSEVMSAGSVTLDEIGFKDYYFSDDCKWINLHKRILGEKDFKKQVSMRKKALAADYFLSSVSAISKDGDLFAACASGTRVGGFTAADNVIVVAGVNKIVDNAEEGISRITEFCLPSESVRARNAYKVQ
eukprot:gene7745-9525_t